MKRLVVGVLAHVDSGKTTLSEALLYRAGSIRKLGRVDHRDAFLDTDALEKARGITIFAKQAVLTLPAGTVTGTPLEETQITLLDTPGHVDFSAEAERTLQVLDYAVLVISGTDGIQSHTMTLWRLLERYHVPTFIYVNKMDLPGADKALRLRELRGRFGDGCVDFTPTVPAEERAEALGVCSEPLMEAVLATGTVPQADLITAITRRQVFPCYFGAALRLDGIDDLLNGLQRDTRMPPDAGSFGARIFKIGADESGARMTYLKVTDGVLKVKSNLVSRPDARVEFEENEAIREDFGDLTGKVWRSNVLVTSTNIKVEAIGSGKKIRGRKHRNWRPDLLILDDIENDENVRTPEQRAKLDSWFKKAVSKAGDDYTDIVYIGTLLHYDSLLANTLKNPGYKAIKYRAVISFSPEADLWQEWENIFTDLSDEDHEENARKFFEAHRGKMLAGTEVLWEEKLSYYDLMVMKVTEGEASFNSEEQNEPINPEDCVFNEEWFDYYNEAEMDFKDKDFQFFGFVDPSLGKTKKSDFSAIITLAKSKVTGYMYVLDADIERRHPDRIITDILEKERWLKRDFGRGYKKFGAETVQFQWFLKEELAKASARAGLYLPIEEVPQTSDKTMRIQTMQPDVKNHYIKFNKKHKRLLEQMFHFPMGAHDDGPDALEGCRTIAKKSKRFRIMDRRAAGL